MTVLQKINKGLDFISNSCIFIGSCLMTFLLIIFGWLVFGRYVLNDTPTWVEQLALVLVCYIVFLGAASGVREDSHLGVTFIREAMPKPIKAFIRFLVDLALMLFGATMLVACFELFQFGWSTKLPMLNVPESIRTLPAVICGGLICVFSLSRVLGHITQFLAGSSDTAQKDIK